MESFVVESLGDCEKRQKLSDGPFTHVKLRQLLREGIDFNTTN